MGYKDEDIVSTEKYRGYTIELIRDEFNINPRKDYDHFTEFILWSRDSISPDGDKAFSTRHQGKTDFLDYLSGFDFDGTDCKEFEDCWRYKYRGRWCTEDKIRELQWKEVHKEYVILGVDERNDWSNSYSVTEPTLEADGFIYASRNSFLNNTGYNKDTLFSTDTKRRVKRGDYVKVDREGMLDEWYGEWGKVIKISRDGAIWVDHEYGKTPSAKSTIHTWWYTQYNVVEVMSNRAVEMLKSEVREYNAWATGNVVGKVISRNGEELDSCWGYYPDGTSNEFGYVIAEAKEWIDWDINDRIKRNHWRSRSGSMAMAIASSKKEVAL